MNAEEKLVAITKELESRIKKCEEEIKMGWENSRTEKACYESFLSFIEKTPMTKRHHELFVGERVYDTSTECIGTIVSIDGEEIELEMSAEDEAENLKMFNFVATEDEHKWKSKSENIYQFADGLLGRDGKPVCYEHTYTEDNYPYFSPYLYENLYSNEVHKKEE